MNLMYMLVLVNIVLIIQLGLIGCVPLGNKLRNVDKRNLEEKENYGLDKMFVRNYGLPLNIVRRDIDKYLEDEGGFIGKKGDSYSVRSDSYGNADSKVAEFKAGAKARAEAIKDSYDSGVVEYAEKEEEYD